MRNCDAAASRLDWMSRSRGIGKVLFRTVNDV